MRIAGVAAALLSLAALGCAGRRPAPPPADPIEKLHRASQNYASIDDISGLIDVSVSEDGEKEKLGGTIVFRRPDDLRLEVMTPLGQAVVTLVHRGGRVVLHDHREDAWWAGRLDDDEAVLAFGVPVRLGAWLETLRDGGVPAAGAIELMPGGRMRASVPERELLLEFDENRPVVRWREAFEGGLLVEDLRFSDFSRQGGVEHPKRVRIAWPADRRSVEIVFRKKAINRGVDAKLFELEPPPGVPFGSLEGER
ncbi:MAG: hypothetical protein CME06_00360 [Gemmatimonadetes bacterium]|nr:hypothetical protein [Gemmatimonadota bacterium]